MLNCMLSLSLSNSPYHYHQAPPSSVLTSVYTCTFIYIYLYVHTLWKLKIEWCRWGKLDTMIRPMWTTVTRLGPTASTVTLLVWCHHSRTLDSWNITMCQILCSHMCHLPSHPTFVPCLQTSSTVTLLLLLLRLAHPIETQSSCCYCYVLSGPPVHFESWRNRTECVTYIQLETSKPLLYSDRRRVETLKVTHTHSRREGRSDKNVADVSRENWWENGFGAGKESDKE